MNPNGIAKEASAESDEANQFIEDLNLVLSNVVGANLASFSNGKVTMRAEDFHQLAKHINDAGVVIAKVKALEKSIRYVTKDFITLENSQRAELSNALYKIVGQA